MLRRYRQEHLLRWWGQLTAAGRERLLAQCGRIDFDEVEELTRTLVGSVPLPLAFSGLTPAPVLSPQALPPAEQRSLIAKGEEALRRGKVAVVTVAGGLGTRLAAGPVKGKVAVGPVSGKSLFHLQAETILALSRRFRSRLPWYIMTSSANDQPTKDYFAENRNFGLGAEGVRFFCQGEMPAADDAGRLLLDAPDHIAESPDGHGGCLYALARSGALRELEGLGVEHLFYYQVDNPLVRIADPLFLGLHVDRRAEASSKALAKRDAGERVGHFLLDGLGHLRVIEYSDMPTDLQQARADDGQLRFRFGSIAIHVFSRQFFADLVSRGVRLPFHRARKSVPFLDDAGVLVTPSPANASKFEQFIFDVLPLAQRTLVVETTRDEFCPVKEPEGPDSPSAARAALARRYARWLEAAGVSLGRGPEGEPAEPVEVSPLVALSAEELVHSLGGRTELGRPIYLTEGGEP
jgi:UDP-N-acetylglucosamine/UDP-N-acetylgalactosamine diphosphorylase